MGVESLAIKYKDCTWCDKPGMGEKCSICHGTKKVRRYEGDKERRRAVEVFVFEALKAKLPELKTLLGRIRDHWVYEDRIYRYYHHSFKVYGLQDTTQEIVDLLQSLAPPEVTLNKMFMEIVEEGTGKAFEMDHNRDWSRHTRPIVEAFLHAKYFLEQLVKYGEELKVIPSMLPSGWASCLYLYDIR